MYGLYLGISIVQQQTTNKLSNLEYIFRHLICILRWINALLIIWNYFRLLFNFYLELRQIMLLSPCHFLPLNWWFINNDWYSRKEWYHYFPVGPSLWLPSLIQLMMIISYLFLRYIVIECMQSSFCWYIRNREILRNIVLQYISFSQKVTDFNF